MNLSLGPENLLSVLSAPLNDERARNAAETQLQEWEKRPGFHSMLQDAYFDDSLPFEARYQAVIYLKNCISRNWRRTSNNALAQDEKDHIRSRLFQRIDEPKRVLASQCTVIVARIARIDFPRLWPTMFEEIRSMLHQVTQSGDYNALYNAYDILVQIIKVLAKVKIGRKKSDMQDQVGSVIGIAIDKYSELVDQWSQTGNEQQMQLSALILKCLCVMLVQGYEHVNRHEQTSQLFNGLVTQYQHLVKMESRNEWADKHIKTMGKMFMRLAEAQPASFVLLDKSTEIVHYCMSMVDQDSSDDFWEQVLIRALSLVRAVIKTKQGSNSIPRRGEQDRQEAKLAQEKLKTEIFVDGFVQNASIKLLTTGMVFRTSDFESWEDDPEEFFVEGQRITWEHQLRTCAGTLFGDFVIQFKDVVSEKVAEYIKMTLEQTQPDTADTVQLEAALFALQEASSEMVNRLDFNSLFQANIAPLCDGQGQMWLIVRRRICRLLSEWVSIDCNDHTRKLAYQIFERFLQDPSNDLEVQLETMTAVRHMVDDWKFDSTIFAPHADTIIHHLFGLLSKVRSVDVQSILMYTLCVMVERVGDNMKPHFGTVLQLLPESWNISALRPVVLQIIEVLVQMLGEPVVETAIPVLQQVLSGDATDDILLIEDALPMWTTVLSRCEKSRQDVLDLIPLLVNGLQNRTELFQLHMDVLEEYILMDHNYVIMNHGMAVFTILAHALESFKSDGIAYICKCLDKLCLVAPLSLYGQPMMESGLLEALGRQAMNDKLEGFNIVKIYGVFARMAMSDPQLTWDMVNKNQDWWHRWVDQFDRIGSPFEQKLHALGLAVMLRSLDLALVGSLRAIIGAWYVSLEHDSPDSLEGGDYDGHEIRRLSDPVYGLSLKQQIQQTVDFLYKHPETRHIVDTLGEDFETLRTMLQ